MLEIQKFLLDRHINIATHQQDRAKLSELASVVDGRNVFLKINRHPKFTNLVQFTYNQIESEKAHPFVREARGLILDQNQDWKIIAYPFNRFFNFGESVADNIDWPSARVQEKIDGSLIIMYWYEYRWRVATKGSPDASGQVGDHMTWNKGVHVPLTFSLLFWNSIEYWLKGLSKSGEFDKNCTYLWELTSPWNRIVCNYSQVAPIGYIVNSVGEVTWSDDLDDNSGYAHDGSRVTLIGVRNNETLNEYSVDDYHDDIHYVVRSFPISTVDACVHAASNLNPYQQEGFVVVDKNFNRVKIKSPAYVAIHHLRDGSTRRRLVDLIKAGEDSELLSYSILDEFPQEKRCLRNFVPQLKLKSC